MMSAFLIPQLVQCAQDGAVNMAVTSLNTLKVAVTDHYAQFGSFPLGDNSFDLTLVREGFLERPLSLLARPGKPTPVSHVRVMEALSQTTIVSATNAAFNFQGTLTNQAVGSIVVEVVISKVTRQDALELSLQIDGPGFTSPPGEADLRGRVKFGAIPADGLGEVHVYITHWAKR
ncbi:MAG TPA: hypothetical protein VL793_00810 [Patescibacteria group bacterium]|nr:hypothetical protein [Patescibacteria group bacterium]